MQKQIVEPRSTGVLEYRQIFKIVLNLVCIQLPEKLFFQIRGTCIIYNIFLFQSKLKFEYVTLVNIS